MWADLLESGEVLVELVKDHLNRFDEDAIDRINRKWSTILFCAIAFIHTTNHYVGQIINCWAPAQFPVHWVEYTNSYCWISNTYYFPMSERDILKTPKFVIGYYQWVSLMLIGQAIFFYLPSLFWTFFSRGVGMDIKRMVKLLRHDTLKPEAKQSPAKFISHHIDRALGSTREYRTGALTKFKQKLAAAGCSCGKRQGCYLVIIYLLTKLLYLAATISQIYVLQKFLGTNYMFYGVQALQDLALKGEFEESESFPRVTLCDFQIRSVGRTQPYTVQCTLPVNLFNEKIYIFVWFWLVTLIILNFWSLVHWIWIAFATNRRRYIKPFLKTHRHYQKTKEDKEFLEYFCTQYLRQDGYFVLRLIGKNTGDVIVGEIIETLWKYSKNEVAGKRKEAV